jgi:GNAT superfamily N-acetyltransferase
MMQIREIQTQDRAKCLRLLLELYAGSRDSDHVPIIDAYLRGATVNGSFLPSCSIASARGTGIGRRLIEAVERWALAQSFSELASDAELSNTHSHGVHEAVSLVEEEHDVHFRKKLSAAE